LTNPKVINLRHLTFQTIWK